MLPVVATSVTFTRPLIICSYSATDFDYLLITRLTKSAAAVMDEVENIAEQGDVILVIGRAHDALKLRVESRSLRNSSEVFGVMFGPNFAEGQNLVNDDPKEVSLPEDDPASIRLICLTVHLKQGDMPLSIDPELLLSLSQAIEKYALAGSMSLVLSQYIHTCVCLKESDWIVKLQAAVVSDRDRLFADVTKELIWNCSGDYLNALQGLGNYPESYLRIVCMLSLLCQGF